MGVTIKEAQLVEELKGNDKLPISDGSNIPKSVSIEQIKEFANKDVKIPTKVSELENDSKFTTREELDDAVNAIPIPDVSGQISEALVNYVKKVEGKGLSTNDFTNELKEKLEGITPYDPSELEAEISKLETSLNTLVSGNVSNAIESFNEIIAFLQNVSDKETLGGIIAGINNRVAEVEEKIPTKTSELNNDSGFLTEHQDISHLATKEELQEKQDIISDLQEIREGAALGATALQEEQYKGTITSVELGEEVDEPELGYVTKGELAEVEQELSELGTEVEKVRFTSVCSVGHVDEHYLWLIASNSESFERIYGYYGIDGQFVEAGIITGKLKVKYGQLIKIVFSFEDFVKNVLIVSFWKDEKLVAKVASSNLNSSLHDTVILEVPLGVDTVAITGAGYIYVAERDLIKENFETSKELKKTQTLFDSMDVRAGNLILASEVYQNYGIDNTGNIVSVIWDLCVVPVNPKTTYYIKCDVYLPNRVGMLGYSENPDVIFGNKMSCVSMTDLQENNGYKEFTTDNTTKYLFINKSPLQQDNKVEIKQNINDSEYATTIGEREISKKLNRFSDKKIAIFGDSITWLSLSGNPERGWASYFKEFMTFGEFVNYARSGATWSNTENTVYDIEENIGIIGDNNVIYNQVNRLVYEIEQGSKVPDYIMFLAGCNDILYESQRPNAMSKTAQEVFEDTTTEYFSKPINECVSIAESIRYIAEMLIEKCPNTQIIICTPLQMTKGSFEDNQKINNIIKESGEYLGWNVIDQSKECGINRLQEIRGYHNTYDGVHTSEIGAKKVAGILAAKCNAIFAI